MALPAAKVARTSNELPNCYPVFHLFRNALQLPLAERVALVAQVDQVLKKAGFSPKGDRIAFHDSESDDGASFSYFNGLKNILVISQTGQFQTKLPVERDQKDRDVVARVSLTAHEILNKHMQAIGLDEVKLIRGLEIGRPGRGEFAENMEPFELSGDDYRNLGQIIDHLEKLPDHSVDILINAPGYTLAKLVQGHSALLRSKVRKFYMSGMGSLNSTEGMCSVLALIDFAQKTKIEVIIRDGNVFRPAEQMNFLYLIALRELAEKCGSSFARAQLNFTAAWKRFDEATQKERAEKNKEVSPATAARTARLRGLLSEVENQTRELVTEKDQTVLSDQFMHILASTDPENLVTEDFTTVAVDQAYRERSRERIAHFKPGAYPIFRIVKNLTFADAKVEINGAEIPLDKDSYLALAVLFTLLKMANEEQRASEKKME